MPKTTDHRKRTDHRGVVYKSLKEMCKAYGITATTYLRRRERSGMSVEEALTTPLTPCNSNPVTYNGVTYKSFTALAKAHGVELATLQARLKKGIPMEEALVPPDRRVVGPDGVTYKDITDLARHYRVSVNVVYSNMYQLKMTPADAVLRAVKTRTYKA